ncbi:MAG: aspartate--tRNA ligase [Oscillospiraceae bacterium]|jgi:aspartyl-tRNA synthetase|nr:aspartate--tRNA ligase [Oscillospiraceae bacterium]
MLEFLGSTKRTNYCGTLTAADVDKTVTVCGWVQRQRDLGKLIFIDLRDRTGLVQLAFDEHTALSVFEKAGACRGEYVLAATGVVRGRSSKNPDLPTGEIEIAVAELKMLSRSETPPFEIIPNCPTSELTRLRYRYLDLRRPDLQGNILLRNKVMKVARDYFYDNGFIEIETPILIKSSPEGARDFLVPSRLHQGSFYALPQSPQIYKQLSMVAGFDRYIQLARCFRDEDSRADRQPEFTQIDLEMSFVDVDDVLAMVEGFIAKVFKEAIGVELPVPVKRLTFAEAMERFGSDKPDMRFAMELVNLNDIVKDCEFSVFSSAVAAGGSVRAFNAKNAVSVLSRKEIDKLTESARGIGAKGLAWVRWAEDVPASSFGKFMKEEEMRAIYQAMGAEKGDVILIVADAKNSLALSVTGALRCEVAKKLNIIKEEFNFLWVVEMPFFDWDEELGQYVAMHHPFTSPMDESLEYLDTDKSKVKAKAYDLVLNGVELLSGSIRITNPDLQAKIFALLGLSQEEAQMKFGYLMDAFKYGAPPHGGAGIGLDRLVMQMLGAESLRDVVVFPKLKDATESMTQCPSPVHTAQLDELGIGIKETHGQ